MLAEYPSIVVEQAFAPALSGSSAKKARLPGGGAGSTLEAPEQLPAVRQGDDAGVSRVAAVSRTVAVHRDLIAHLQIRPRPSPVNKAVGATHFEAPTGGLAVFILCVDIQPGVWIDPLKTRNGAGDYGYAKQ